MSNKENDTLTDGLLEWLGFYDCDEEDIWTDESGRDYIEPEGEGGERVYLPEAYQDLT